MAVIRRELSIDSVRAVQSIVAPSPPPERRDRPARRPHRQVTVMLNPLRMSAALTCVWAAGTAAGQGLRFMDQTSARLVLSVATFTDAEEKDMAAADLDADGDPDLVVVRKAPFSVAGPRPDILLMNEGGVLIDRTAELAPGFLTAFTDARDVVIADVTGDAWPDVVIVGTFGSRPRLYVNRGLDAGGAWLGLMDETVSRLPRLATLLNQPSAPRFCAGAAGDIDGDGDLDLYFSNYNPEPAGVTEDVLLINNGAGVFTDDTASRLGDFRFSAFNTSGLFMDADNDGDQDIVKVSTLYDVAPWNETGVFLLLNDGAGRFTGSAPTRLASVDPYMVAAGALDQDQRPDLYVVKDTDDLTLTTAGAAGAGYLVTGVVSPRTTELGGNIHMADVDGDGDLDVGVGPVDTDIQNCDGPQAGSFELLANDGAGGLSVMPIVAGDVLSQRPHDFEFLDLDGDGMLDIVMGLCSGWRVYMQQEPPPPPPPPCPLDLTGDRIINALDITLVLNAWGLPGGPMDLNGDGVVDGVDVTFMLSSWGPCDP
ncbi:MAG: VCBS repeat-containing protein [Planctomycetota bacterium]|nr:MAG: VCBS repeat-containing protein [Planctomycetota bacterium]